MAPPGWTPQLSAAASRSVAQPGPLAAAGVGTGAWAPGAEHVRGSALFTASAVPGSSHGPGEPLTQQCPHHHSRARADASACGALARPRRRGVGSVFLAIHPWPPPPSAARSVRCSCTSIPAAAKPGQSPASRSTSAAAAGRCRSLGSCPCSPPSRLARKLQAAQVGTVSVL